MNRRAQYGDIPQVSGLLADFYAESAYAAPLINVEKTYHVLEAYIAAEEAFFEVIDLDNTLQGFMIAERAPDLWSDAIKTVEVALYVKPICRGRPCAGRLLLNFATWAKQVPSAIRVEASSGITESMARAVYEKLGYEPRGTIHGMEAY